MPTIRLTARGVETLKTNKLQEDFWDDLVPGLIFRVGRGGTKSYLVRYRTGGSYRRLTLGKHPHLGLADAREQAREMLAKVQRGDDPAQERQVQRSHDVTFAALAAEVVEAKSGQWREKTRRERQRIIDTELLPIWGKRPAASISRREVMQLLERIGQRAPVMANRVLATIRLLFNEGLDREFPGLEASPVHRIKPLPERGRDRYLDEDEIRVVWNATQEESPVMRAVFRFTLLTAQRVGSVCSLRWSDIDRADIWHIPAPAFKGKRDHLVPLASEALAILDEVRPISGDGEHAFPGTRGKPHVMSTNKAMQRIRERTDVPSWTVHDFRTTFRTHATRASDPDDPRDPAGLGVSPNVADAVLGHKEASLGFGRYTGDASRYLLSEKRQALKLWGSFVLRVVQATV